MKISKYILAPGLVFALGLAVASCSDDNDFTETIFPDVPETVDSDATTYQFDTWLNQNFRDVYNMQFVYRMKDVETNYDYNLTPASISNAMSMAVLVKYIWYDSYAEAFGGGKSPEQMERGQAFVKAVGPKMIHLIGSPMYNTNGSETLGYATGGVQITLCRINDADFNNIQLLNNRYFHTMHHEYCHILHQTKNYPTAFNEISNGRYDSSNWQDRNGGICASLGFQTPYASSSYTEDFAETVSGYLTRNDEDWRMLKWVAGRGWYSGDDETKQDEAHCYYYYRNEDDRTNDVKTYTLKLVADAFMTNVRLQDTDSKFYKTPEEVDAYLANFTEKLKNRYKDTAAQEQYGKKYAQLTGDQKTVIDVMADSRQYLFPVEDNDKADGIAIMEQKINIARTWFKDAWGLNLDELRRIVQERSANYNLDDLLNEIYSIPVPGAAAAAE